MHHQRCRKCEKSHTITILDPHGEHAIKCGAGPDRIAIHDGVVNYLASLLRRAGLDHTVEPRSTITKRKSRLADIATDSLYRKETTWLDVGISYPHHPKTQLTQVPADKDNCTAALAYMRDKHNNFKQYEQNNLVKEGTVYRPVIFETIGAIPQETDDILDNIATNLALNIEQPKSKVRNSMNINIFTMLQRANANAIISHYALRD